MTAGALTEVPLGLELAFPNRPPCRIELGGLPCGRLVRQLAEVLLDRTNTAGTVKAPDTARGYASTIRHLARHLGAGDFEGGVVELTEALVFDYWRVCGPMHENHSRVLLTHVEERRPGTLQPSLVAQLAGVRLHPSPSHKPRQPYSAGETERLVAACRSAVSAAEARMTAAEELAATGHRPSPHDWREEANVAWLLEHDGPLQNIEVAAVLGLPEWHLDKAIPGMVVRLLDALFPTVEAVIAFRVLVGLETGICPEGVDALGADCLEWVGAGEARIRWFKARASGQESHVFPSRGPWSPGRLIERWLALSARVRRFAPDPGPLWLFCGAAHHRPEQARFGWDARHAFVARHGLTHDDGRRLSLGFAPLRPTYFARHDRHWSGGLRIDPNHSRRIEGDHYLAQTRASAPLEATIEAAQRDALRKAATAPLTVLGADELARLADDREAAAARLGMTESAAGELVAGERDVFAAACKDFLNSPHGAPGSPCPSPVWTCLHCPLAVFTPTKVPNLLRLRDHLDRQWRALPAPEWLRAYGTAQVRLERDILPRFGPEVIDAARAEVEADPEPALYLRPEEHPWPS